MANKKGRPKRDGKGKSLEKGGTVPTPADQGRGNLFQLPDDATPDEIRDFMANLEKMYSVAQAQLPNTSVDYSNVDRNNTDLEIIEANRDENAHIIDFQILDPVKSKTRNLSVQRQSPTNDKARVVVPDRRSQSRKVTPPRRVSRSFSPSVRDFQQKRKRTLYVY